MRYLKDENGIVSKVSEAVETDMDEVPEPPENASIKDGEVDYRYDEASDEFVEIQRDNRSFYQKILDKFEEWEANQSAALDRVDEILSESPTLEIAVREGNAEVVENRLTSLSNQVLDQSEKQELIDLIT